MVSLESEFFPRWLAVTSLILALISIVGAFTIGYDTTGIQTTAGVAAILDSVWFFVASFFLWRDPKVAMPSG